MIGEGFYNSQLIAFWAVWASCVRRKLIWPQSIFCEAGGGEGLGRCFLPDCPFCIVYQLSTDQFVWLWPGRGGTAGESWEVKPHQYGLMRPEKIIWLVWTWSEKILWSSRTTQIFLNSSLKNARANIATKRIYTDAMMEQNLSFIRTDYSMNA